jgi:hypothetical protein
MSYLGFDKNLNIEGCAVLNKYVLVPKIKIKRKIKFSRFLPRIEKIESPYEEREGEWGLDSFEGQNCSILIKDGEIKSEQYQAKLKADGLKNRIVISDKLLEAVFKPIEEKLLGEYERVHKFCEENRGIQCVNLGKKESQ